MFRRCTFIRWSLLHPFLLIPIILCSWRDCWEFRWRILLSLPGCCCLCVFALYYSDSDCFLLHLDRFHCFASFTVVDHWSIGWGRCWRSQVVVIVGSTEKCPGDRFGSDSSGCGGKERVWGDVSRNSAVGFDHQG